MNKLIKSITLSMVLAISLTAALAGCGTKNETDTGSDISGSVTAVGSSALQPLAEKAAQMFMDKNKDANIQVQGGGSGTGLKQVSEGGADIGNSDVYAAEKLPEDKAKALVDHKVCVVGFATVVNPKIKVDNLTKQQLIDIFSGKITNWKDVGGDDMKVVIINRPSSSGTRATFKKYALDGAEEAEGKALTEDQSGTVKKAVAETDGAISYLALSYIDKSVKTLKYEGVEATVENITSGKYPIWSYEHMYTKGKPTGAVKAFIDYMTSSDFTSSISEMGYIPNSDMKISRDK
ncbi:phosphate binding protein [Ruminiclostridium papyrosolvens DSM 2782]|uniref:Phosphate-binding protein n=1 Tax=Ruminiclostridium papyrosolvens DSM 2782 TaxID=588581 RepID=F1TDB4_9FIRM|nr:phosphate ABC transporter substrate-binding protein [Ruminiclostridium papyrosolvens]EGD47552.1 phosphate binding protein [Ruminiclostridium papyrosolvens DSM 2782]WES36502.1 phosphate ABC transporter substrate-binding protein [Ruminiclostridium papyrosolvens DSM 2782]